MNHTQTPPLKPERTGKRFASVTALLDAEGASDIAEKVREHREQVRICHQLAMLRVKAGLTQEQMAEQLGYTQSAVSKLEAGPDADVTIGQLRAYALATGERIAVLAGEPLTHVEAVKVAAFTLRNRLEKLAELSHNHEDMRQHVNAFFGEALFNFLNIFSDCQGKFPSPYGSQLTLEVLHSGEQPSAGRNRAKATRRRKPASEAEDAIEETAST